MNLRAARNVGIAGILLCIGALAWYLGSPLFLRTTVNEPFPAPAAAAAVAPAGSPGAPGAPSTTSAPATTPSGPITIGRGELGYVDAIHNGTGSVLLIRTADALVLRFADVAITNAPDVHVYLSRETGGKWSEATSHYVGPLKATNGSFNYALPVELDVTSYKSVVVWCRQFSVLVTWADLH